MIMTEKEKVILQEIVNLQGDCLDGTRCRSCPFARNCLPEFLLSPKKPPTKNQRFQMALDVIVNEVVMEDSGTMSENQQWFKKS